ncbi:FimV/HubP family polar landmark protein, partial [Alishewanella longhuensis]
MPVLLVLLLLIVNFSSLVMADTVPTQIRGPKNADSALLQKQFGPLTASDTLWRIAEQVKPSNTVTTYQVMYALFVKNPQAFNDANFNHLQPGAVLLLPDLREIRNVDPEVAKRKAETDDALWAQKIARDAAARARSREQATRPNPVQQQTAAELNALKDQYQDSMQLIEGIARENENLRGSLGRVEQELEGLKAQLAEDSVLQQQLNQLLQQQQQILREQQAAKEAEEAARLAEAEKNNLSKLLNNPLAWILAASVPAILLLLGAVFWIKRRGRKTEEAVAAAVKEPTAVSGYQSPLPPLDPSQDFDDSLFDIDDSLLGDPFSAGDKTASTNTDDTFLDDELPDFSDDIILDDIDDEDPLQTDILDSGNADELDITLDGDFDDEQNAGDDLAIDSASETNFDANNILSDMDLSALLMAEDEVAEVIDLADPEETETDDLLEQESIDQPVSLEQLAPEAISLTDQDDIDSLLEEIELELPLDEADTEQSIDDILAQHGAAEVGEEQASTVMKDDMLATLNQADEQSESSALDVADINEMLSEQEEITISEEHFDSSDLDEFAEQLAAEVDDAEENASLTEDELQLSAEMDDILEQAAVQQITPSEEDALGAQIDEENLANEDSSDEILQHTDSTLRAEALDDVPSDENTDNTPLDETELQLDLAIAEDASVSRPTEAALAVENPSKVLDSYPELALHEFEQEDDGEFNLSFEQITQLTQ